MGQTERIELSAEPRTVTGKQVNRLRRAGWVPAVMYGHGFEPLPLQLKERQLRQVLAHVTGSQLISVKIGSQSEPEMALVRDVQRNPIKGSLLHIDFYRVRMDERLRTEIPLVLEGESPAVRQKEGILLQGLSTIEVECLPSDLVGAITVDLSSLVKIDQSIYVRDLAIPAGIEVLTDPDEMVVRVVPLAEEEIAEGAPAVEAAEVEVITEAKAEKEAGEEEG